MRAFFLTNHIMKSIEVNVPITGSGDTLAGTFFPFNDYLGLKGKNIKHIVPYIGEDEGTDYPYNYYFNGLSNILGLRLVDNQNNIVIECSLVTLYKQLYSKLIDLDLKNINWINSGVFLYNTAQVAPTFVQLVFMYID